MSLDVKGLREMTIFREFVMASRLPIELDSIDSAEPPEPDIKCIGPSGACRFELSEVLWEDPSLGAPIASLAHGLAHSEKASDRKAALITAGKPEEAEQIQTAGSYGYPALASVLQSLAKKCAKRYPVEDCELSLLLYYERQNPVEPFYELVDQFSEAIRQLLEESQFACVWLYHHSVAYSFDLSNVTVSSRPLSIPLRSFISPDSCGGVVGRMQLHCGDVLMVFDDAYARRFGDIIAKGRRQRDMLTSSTIPT